MKLKKLKNFILHLIFALAFMEIIVFFFWLNYPYTPLVFNTKEFIVKTKEVKRGEKLQYIVDYTKNMNLKAIVSCTYSDGLNYSIDPIESGKETGHHVITITDIVPVELPPAVYVKRCTYTYKVNPIRTITVTHSTEKFIVK